MKNTLLRNVFSIICAIFIFTSKFAYVSATDYNKLYGFTGNINSETIRTTAGMSNKSAPEMIGNIIKIILGLTGTIALVFIIYGGIKWMTSKGEPGKIADARKLMTAGIIGLVIIVSAYAISDFVIKQISITTGGSGSSSSNSTDTNTDTESTNQGGDTQNSTQTQNGGGDNNSNTTTTQTETGVLSSDNSGASTDTCTGVDKTNFGLYTEIAKYIATPSTFNSRYINFASQKALLLQGTTPLNTSSCDIYTTKLSGCPTKIIAKESVTNINSYLNPTTDNGFLDIDNNKIVDSDNILVFICYNTSSEVVYATQKIITKEPYTYCDNDSGVQNPIVENLATMNSDNITIGKDGENYKFNIGNINGKLNNDFTGVTYKIYGIDTNQSKTACLVSNTSIVKGTSDNGIFNASENIQADVISEIKSNSSTKTYYALFYKLNSTNNENELITAVNISSESFPQ